MKAIIMSVRPEWVAKILNREKTIEIRKKFPKDYVGWVYIYCTKKYDECLWYKNDSKCYVLNYGKPTNDYLNGKVVARFWCDKVDEFYDFDDDLCKQACLDRGEMLAYLGDKKGYAIHITNLKIFDNPKEIYEFYKVGYENSVIATKKYILNAMNREERRRYKTEIDLKINNEIAVIKDNYKLTRAPQSWQFIEV